MEAYVRTQALVKSSPLNVVLIRETPAAKTAVSTLDYNDLNAYLLVVVGLATPAEDQVSLYDTISRKAREGVSIPLRDIQLFCRKESLITLPFDESPTKAIEVFGSGIHKVLITNPEGDVVGVLTQLRLVEFFWNEGVNFPTIDRLYPMILRDLGIGGQHIVAIKYIPPFSSPCDASESPTSTADP